MTLASFLAMDEWLSGMRADTNSATLEQRVLAAKPPGGFDFCYLTADTGFTTKVRDQALCDADARLKPHSSPRQVAGGPITENVFKCQLRPFSPDDYPGLAAAQLDRLQAVFPDGVCDWTKPGVGQKQAQSPMDFSTGPGGVPLPEPPTSHAL
jgi:hypothetical protein